MTTALLVAAIVLASGVCPAMMWWNVRRGRAATGCVPRRASAVDELRAERQRLSARIAEAEARARVPTRG